LCSKRIGVTGLTFLGHVTSSVVIGGPLEPKPISNGYQDIQWQM